jgi:hypothetical protein
MVKEMEMKVFVYNLMLGLSEAQDIFTARGRVKSNDNVTEQRWKKRSLDTARSGTRPL